MDGPQFMNPGRKIRVLESIRQGRVGGGESHVLDLVRNLDRGHFDPLVLSFSDGPMIQQLDEWGIANFVIPSERAFDWRIWARVKRLVKGEEIDLIHAHGSRAASNLLPVARQLGLPIIYTIHGWSFHEGIGGWKKKLRVLSEKWLTASMSCNISVSHSNQQTGIRQFRSFHSEVVPNGINLKKFDPDQVFPDIREPLNIPGDALLVIFIARMTAQKDPLSMLAAFKLAIPHLEHLRLLMVGEGELKDGLVRKAQELGLEAYTIFQPFRKDIPALLKAADIYCLPSLWEGLPIGLLEAMAMKKAVIASGVDGSKEIIQPGSNGLLIPSGNPEELAGALITLGQDKAARIRLGENARRTVEEGYSLSGMIRSIESIYERVIFRPQIS